MQTAACLMPTSVGVAPGTTTLLLSGPTTPVVGCETPERTAHQHRMMFPPGKQVLLTSLARVRDTVSRVARVPYESIAALKGARRRSLGYVVQTANQAGPTAQIVAATKDTRYCSRRPEREERGPNYREAETGAYARESHLGAVPTDLQLASQYGYTPVVSQWIPFQQGTWSPAPWNPPTGRAPLETAPTYWTKPLAGPMGDVVTPPEMDPAAASLMELRRHQDRMYMLGIISAGAVASTALVNVFRYANEKRGARKKTAVAAEPAPSISGPRRRRRRR